MNISKTYTLKDFPNDINDWTLDDKLKLFEDRVYGWQLEIADTMLNSNLSEMRHSAFAALTVMLSYFEMIEKYRTGETDSNREKRSAEIYITASLHRLFPAYSVENFKHFYILVRCSIFHSGFVNSKVILSSDFGNSIVFDGMSYWYINPHKLIKDLIFDLQGYTSLIRDQSNTDLRQNFINRFDFEVLKP